MGARRLRLGTARERGSKREDRRTPAFHPRSSILGVRSLLFATLRKFPCCPRTAPIYFVLRRKGETSREGERPRCLFRRHGGVAQLVRVPDCRSGGCGF